MGKCGVIAARATHYLFREYFFDGIQVICLPCFTNGIIDIRESY